MRNDLDVFAYVKDVLDRLLAGETDYHALRPDAWKQAHPEAVRVYRAEERAARAACPAALYWPGEGRKIPKIRFRRGSIVHRRKLSEMPTGFLGESEDD